MVFKNRVIIAGGGCEGNSFSGTNNFLEPIRERAQKYESLGWEVTVLYSDGGEDLVDVDSTAFNETNFFNAIDQVASETTNRDNVMIEILTHGSEGNHGYCFDQDGVQQKIWADDLNERLLQKATVGRWAIYDHSCYGGESVSRIDPRIACVISDSQFNSTSLFGNFFQKSFLENMTSGQTIEEVFINSFIMSDLRVPQISSLRNEEVRIMGDIGAVFNQNRQVYNTNNIQHSFNINSLSGDLVSHDNCPNENLSSILSFIDSNLEILGVDDRNFNNLVIAKERISQIYHDIVSLRELEERLFSCESFINGNDCEFLKEMGFGDINLEKFSALEVNSSDLRKAKRIWEMYFETLSPNPVKQYAELGDNIQTNASISEGVLRNYFQERSISEGFLSFLREELEVKRNLTRDQKE